MRFLLAIIFLVVTLTALTEAQEWISWSVPQGVPPFQAPRGRENNYNPLYVIRAEYEGDLIPGKFSVEYKKGYVTYNGKEIVIQQFEFFTPRNVKWIPASNGTIPPNAVIGGHTKAGETLYIGRAWFMRSLTPGKILPSDGIISFPYQLVEEKSSEYEVLVYT